MFIRFLVLIIQAKPSSRLDGAVERKKIHKVYMYIPEETEYYCATVSEGFRLSHVR